MAGDKDFVNDLLEDAAGVLRNSSQGEQLIEGLPPGDMNFIAAVWYAERCGIDSGEDNPATLEARKAWLLAVRRALPSCFCDPSDLHTA